MKPDSQKFLLKFYSEVALCHTLNPYKYPAKDRSGRLEWMEEPHLGRLMDKIRQQVKPAPHQLTYTCPHPTTETEGE